MKERESRGSHVAIIWGAFILFLGVVVLLQATGVLEWHIWGTLWKFWPVLIVLVGMSILLTRFPPWIMAVSAVAILGICLWISALQYTPSLAHDVILVEQKFTYPALGVERVDASVESTAGSILITDLVQSNQQMLCEITDGHDMQNKPEKRIITMETDFVKNDGTVNVNVRPVDAKLWEDWLVRWGLYFKKEIPLSLDLMFNRSRININLADLDVNVIHLKMNVSSGLMKLPTSAGETTIDIDMDVSNLEIFVPEGVAVKIKADINLGFFSIDKGRFLRQGDYYISTDYDTATNRVELNILCDVSRLVIK